MIMITTTTTATVVSVADSNEAVADSNEVVADAAAASDSGPTHTWAVDRGEAAVMCAQPHCCSCWSGRCTVTR